MNRIVSQRGQTQELVFHWLLWEHGNWMWLEPKWRLVGGEDLAAVGHLCVIFAVYRPV